MTRILDLSVDLSGRYAARLLADHGADVVAVELPADSTAGAMAREAAMRSVDLEPLRDHLGRNKSVLVSDYGTPEGLRALDDLIRNADIVIHTFGPALSDKLGLTADRLKTLNPALLIVTITPYGYTAADTGHGVTEKTLYAEGGGTLVAGVPETRFPLAPNLPVVSTIGALYGAMAVLARIIGSRRGGTLGGHVDIALRDLIPISLERVLSFYTYMKVIPYRGTRRERIDQAATMGDFQAKDGGFHIFAQHDPYVKVAELIGRPDLIDDEEWLNPHKRTMPAEAVRKVVSDAVSKLTIAELEARGRELGIPAGPIREVDQLADQSQLRFRDALERTSTGIRIEEPYRFTNFDRPREPIASIAAAPVRASGEEKVSAHPANPGALSDGPLAGIRVLDLTHAYAGPSCTRILSDLGAEVIKIESVTHMDSIPRGLLPFDNKPTEQWWERSGYFADRNLGKKSLTLDMGSEEGRALFLRLIEKVDVVATNFRPRVMAGWGLGPEKLLATKPDLVVLSMSGFGGKGPDSEKPALAGLIEATSGFTSLMRYKDGESPSDAGFSFGDMISGLYAATSTMMAIERRDRTGIGDAIDFSCCEAPLPLLAVQLHDWARTGQRPSVSDDIVAGGRHVMVRTQGDDTPERWAIVFVRPDQEEVAGSILGDNPSAVVDAAQAAFVGDMRAKGFIVAPLVNAEEIIFSPDFAKRHVFQVVDRPSVGPLPYSSAFPVLADGQPLGRRNLLPPPRLGAHSAAVFGDLLGMGPREYDGLVDRLVTGETPVGKPKAFLRWPIRLDELVRRTRVRPVAAAAQKLASYFHYALEDRTEPTKQEEHAS